MKRTPAFFLSGVLTIALTTAVFWLNSQVSADSLNNNTLQTLAPVQAVDQTAPAQTNQQADLAGVYSQREATLLAQVAKGQAALRDLDKTYQAQIKTLQDQLAQFVPAAKAESVRLQAVQDQLTQVQAVTHQDDVNYRQQVAALQQREAQAQAQLQDLQGQLQNAYTQIVARQAGQGQNATTTDQNSSQPQANTSEHHSHHHHQKAGQDD